MSILDTFAYGKSPPTESKRPGNRTAVVFATISPNCSNSTWLSRCSDSDWMNDNGWPAYSIHVPSLRTPIGHLVHSATLWDHDFPRQEARCSVRYLGVRGNWGVVRHRLYKPPVLWSLIRLLGVRAITVFSTITLWISGQCQDLHPETKCLFPDWLIRQGIYLFRSLNRALCPAWYKQLRVLRTVAGQTGWNVYFPQQLQLVVLRQRVPISFLEENSHKQKPLPCWLPPAYSHHWSSLSL